MVLAFVTCSVGSFNLIFGVGFYGILSRSTFGNLQHLQRCRGCIRVLSFWGDSGAIEPQSFSGSLVLFHTPSENISV